MQTSRLTLEEVRTPAACEEFLALPATDPREVPVLADDVRAWFRGEHPHVDSVVLLLVRDESGAPVGRCLTHRSSEADAVLAAGLGPGPFQLFGAVAAGSAEALRALLDEVFRRAQAAGAAGVFGPVTLLPNQLGGALTAGFEDAGFFDSPWTPALLAESLTAAGFQPWYPAATWEIPVRHIPPEKRRRPTKTELAAAGVRRLPASRLRLRGPRGQVELMRQALNASFAQLPYYTSISRRQMTRQTAGLELLMDPRLVVMLGDGSGDLASFALVVPDPAPLLRRSRGELGLRQLPALLRRGRLRDAVLIVQGTRPDRQGEGLLTLVARELFAALHAGGWDHLRVTFIGEENHGSSAVFAKAGGRPLHRLSFFHRRLPRPGRSPDPQSWCLIAARAPSAHNTQPWEPQLLDDGAEPRIELTVDPARTLPVGDPDHRDLHLSLGAWIESFAVAAAAEGQQVRIDDVRGAGPEIRIVLTWTAGEAQEVTADVDDVLTRRVHRGTLLPPGELHLPEGFQSLDALDADPLERRAGRHLASSPSLVAELLDWLRLDPSDPRWHEDGLSAECLQLPRTLRRGLNLGLRGLRPVLPPLLGRFSPPLAGAGTGVPVVMEARDLSPAGLVEAGRRLQRLWLELHRQGMAASPASQVIDCPATVGSLGVDHPVAYFRVGIPDDVPPRSARRHR
ncbi:hypothetical protein [Nesterenkonia xinjiangensis]|uniref:N-acetyltransferase domain-containing protein n=1 Tax=Nesterenkonia xinjiangensis TaxID=225327 RepID=A0A7Z0GIU7_9MICC|nr:hypothetical protein [Nesterenkonia xinjiangensis]NYJ76795.1 hypothetical protein [Nesterenkonia xinjiangensis]